MLHPALTKVRSCVDLTIGISLMQLLPRTNHSFHNFILTGEPEQVIKSQSFSKFMVQVCSDDEHVMNAPSSSSSSKLLVFLYETFSCNARTVTHHLLYI